MTTKFELRGVKIHYTQTGQLICSVWPESQASEEGLEGESWLDMYNRTAPERATIKAQTEKRAASICNFLNSQILTSETVEKIVSYIEEVETARNYGHNNCKTIHDLVKADKMPEIYTALTQYAKSKQTATQ